jgi:putative intracellular protease/amidase
MKILMVLTSHDQLGNTGRPTGFWLEEFAAPYYVFKDAGAEATIASPKGGQPPIDPKSDEPGNQTDAMARFKKDPAAQKVVANTVKLGGVLGRLAGPRVPQAAIPRVKASAITHAATADTATCERDHHENGKRLETPGSP